MPDGTQKTASKSDRSKADMIEATARLMREKDTIHISLSEIAEASGLNSALVKYHFGNKEGLMFAVLEESFKQGRDGLARLLVRTDLDPEQMMRQHLTGLVLAYRQVPFLSKLMYEMTRDATKERVECIVDDMVKPIASAQAKILDAGHKAGLFRQVNARSFYFASLGAAHSMYSQRYIMTAAYGAEEIDETIHRENAQEVVTLLMNGILVKTDATT